MKSLDRPILLSDLLILALATVSGSSLGAVMDAGDAFVVAAIGAFSATIVALASRRVRLLATETIALSVLAVIVVGGFVAGRGLPDWPRFFRASTQGWADLLTSTPPVVSTGAMLVLPFLLAAVAGIVGFAMSRWTPIPGLAAVAAFAFFGVGILLAVERRELALVQGAAMLALALCLGWVQQRAFGSETDETIGATTEFRRRRRLVGGLFMVVAATLSAPMLAPRLPGFDQRERLDLRERLAPPFNPLDRASPLIELKSNFVDEDEVLFVVEGEQIPRLLKLASMGSFDGETWTIADPDLGLSTRFEPVDQTLPPDPRVSADRTRRDTKLRITRNEAHRGPWLPLPLGAVALESEEQGLFFSPHASTLADPEQRPLTYTVVGTAAPLTLTQAAAGASGRIFASSHDRAVFPDTEGVVSRWVADVVQAPSDDGTADVETDAEQIDAVFTLERLQAALLSELPEVVAAGLDREVPPGHSWNRLAQMVAGDQVVGYEEQFAALGAIAVHLRGLRARVAVGYLLPRPDTDGSEVRRVDVTRRDATAWIEVLTMDQGWVVLDVTPDDEVDDLPPDQPSPSIATAPQQVPEPVEFESAPARRPSEPDPEGGCDEGVEECNVTADAGFGIAGPVAMAGISLAILAAPVGAILGTKALLLRRRRTSGAPDRRVNGAWLEANDRLIELGDRPEHRWSVMERARFNNLESADSRRSFATLAAIVDRSAFGPEAPDEVGAGHAWDLYNELRTEIARDASWRQRVRRRLSLAPFTFRTARSAPVEEASRSAHV